MTQGWLLLIALAVGVLIGAMWPYTRIDELRDQAEVDAAHIAELEAELAWLATQAEVMARVIR